MPTPIETDADKLIRFRNWESNLLTALETPETVSAFGGMPDSNGPVQVARMPGRAQLLSELMFVQDVIARLGATWEITSEMT